MAALLVGPAVVVFEQHNAGIGELETRNYNSNAQSVKPWPGLSHLLK
jgi:hypothetical protein